MNSEPFSSLFAGTSLTSDDWTGLPSTSVSNFGNLGNLALGSHDDVNEVRNVASTLSLSTSEIFELRKRMYVDTNLFYEDANVPADACDEETEKTLGDLERSISEGRKLVQAQFVEYSQLKTALESNGLRYKQFTDNTKCILEQLEFVDAAAEALGIDKDELDICRNVMHAIKAKAAAGFEKVRDETTALLKDKAKRVRRMAKLYGMLRDTSACACPICLTSEVNVYVQPCGHTFCKNCVPDGGTACVTNSSGTFNKRCYICRAGIQRTLPLFMS